MITKICGITSEVEAEYLNEAKPDLAGFVMFYPKSKRNVSVEQAVRVKALLDGGIKTVAVVVSPTAEQVEEITKAGSPHHPGLQSVEEASGATYRRAHWVWHYQTNTSLFHQNSELLPH